MHDTSPFDDASRLAQMILHWHEEVGRTMLHRLPPSAVDRYLAVLSELRSGDPHDPVHISTIANEQLNGALRWFYTAIPSGVPIEPDQLTPEHRQDEVRLLGEIAEEIVRLLTSVSDSGDAQQLERFTLPYGWLSEPGVLHPASVRIPISGEQSHRAALRSYFTALSEFHDAGVGGQELMVSMNEDVNIVRRAESRDYLEIYSPGAFDFQLATGTDQICTLALSNLIEVGEVLLGHGPEDSDLRPEEDDDGN